MILEAERMALNRFFFSVFPAYAGVILVELPEFAEFSCFPRVCGGDPGKTGIS